MRGQGPAGSVHTLVEGGKPAASGQGWELFETSLPLTKPREKPINLLEKMSEESFFRL